MLRTALLVASLSLIGCTSARTSALVFYDPIDPRSGLDSTPSDQPDALTEAEPGDGDWTWPGSEPVPPPPDASPGSALDAIVAAPEDDDHHEESLHGSRTTFKLGYTGSTEDELDDGWIFNVSWMRFFSALLALELELGYMDVDCQDGGIDTEAWAIPIMVNGRLNLPIWILDAYGGLGLGTFYYDAESRGGGSSEDDDGFIFGGNAFLGATLNVAEAVALGLELKYYSTEDMGNVDVALDCYALMLTLGFSR
jgi:hypothetical protein